MDNIYDIEGWDDSYVAIEINQKFEQNGFKVVEGYIIHAGESEFKDGDYVQTMYNTGGNYWKHFVDDKFLLISDDFNKRYNGRKYFNISKINEPVPKVEEDVEEDIKCDFVDTTADLGLDIEARKKLDAYIDDKTRNIAFTLADPEYFKKELKKAYGKSAIREKIIEKYGYDKNLLNRWWKALKYFIKSRDPYYIKLDYVKRKYKIEDDKLFKTCVSWCSNYGLNTIYKLNG